MSLTLWYPNSASVCVVVGIPGFLLSSQSRPKWTNISVGLAATSPTACRHQCSYSQDSMYTYVGLGRAKVSQGYRRFTLTCRRPHLPQELSAIQHLHALNLGVPNNLTAISPHFLQMLYKVLPHIRHIALLEDHQRPLLPNLTRPRLCTGSSPSMHQRPDS